MNWFFIALAAPFLWALTNISDQYLVKRYTSNVRGSGALVLFSSFIGIAVALIISFFTSGLFNISNLDKTLLIISGVLTIVWVIFYLFALKIEQVSSVIPWFMTVPVFGFILSYIFLSETLQKQEIISSLIVLLGVLLISLDFSGVKKKFKWRPALYMTLACTFLSIIGVIFKYVTISGNFWVSSFWQNIGLGTAGIIIFIFNKKYRQEFVSMNKTGGARIFFLNAVSEIFTVTGNLLTNYALLLAPVAMVYLVGSFQPAILLLMTLFTTKFLPGIAEEDLSRRVLIPKIVSIAIITFGSIMLFI